MGDSGFWWFLFLAAFVGVMLTRAMRAPMDERPSHHDRPEPVADTVRVVPRAAAARPPVKIYARWKIRYRDYAGVSTERVVRVLAVRPRLERLEVWCELRGGERTLSFWGLEEIIDAETGEIIDFDAWLRAYRASRRRGV